MWWLDEQYLATPFYGSRPASRALQIRRYGNRKGVQRPIG
jgi:hypothetical protein